MHIYVHIYKTYTPIYIHIGRNIFDKYCNMVLSGIYCEETKILMNLMIDPQILGKNKQKLGGASKIYLYFLFVLFTIEPLILTIGSVLKRII